MFWHKKIPAQARIVADESYVWRYKSRTVSLHYQKYIIEVFPPNEAPFRTETKVWVNWPNIPEPGTTVNVLYRPGSKRAKIVIKGDPRFDWKLRRAQEKAQFEADRERLLNAPAGQPPPR